MADYDPKDPRQQRPDNDFERRGLQQNLQGRRPGFNWWWLLLIIIVFVGLWVAWGGWWGGMGPHGGAQGTHGNLGNAQTTQQVGAPETASVQQLVSNPKQYQGLQVTVPEAIVRKQVGNDSVIVNGPKTDQTVMVKLPANAKTLKQGTHVEITGTVGSGSEQQNGTAENQKVYLQASAITPVVGNENGTQTKRP